MKLQCMEVLFIILTFAIPIAVCRLTQPNLTYWPSNAIRLGDKKYEEVSLVKPKFKSKKLAGLEWFQDERTDSSSAQTRHLDWLSSDDDSENAEPTEKSFISQLFEEDEDDEKSEIYDKGVEGSLRRRHRKKYVKVDKMIFPLLLAYKLKFFTMVPLLIGALILLVTSTGLAGFFFALFAAAAGLHHHKGSHG